MLNEKFLKDDFVLMGNDINEFKAVVMEIVKCTSAEKLTTSEIKILSYRPSKTETGQLSFWAMDAENPWKSQDDGLLCPGRLKTEKILSKGDFQALIDEMTNGIKVMIMKEGCAYFVSKGALETMGARAGLKGDILYNNCTERNLCLAKGFGNVSTNKNNATIILRNFKGCRKVMAMFSEKYTYVPQTCLIDILNQLSKGPLGRYSVCKWNIDHNITQIWIEFAEKAEELRKIYKLKDNLIPGLYLAASDTGNSSLKAIGTWRIGRSISYDTLGFGEDAEGTRGSRKHTGKVDAKAFCEKADKEVFSKQSKLPEALCDLMMFDVTNPNWHLTSNIGQRSNRETVAASIKGCFTQIGMVSAVGKSQEKVIYELLCQEINPTVAYTAYDIAIMIMSLSGRISGLSKTADRQLSYAIAKAPYCKFGKPAASALVLTA